MSLYERWIDMSQNQGSESAEIEFWQEFLQWEKAAYEKLISSKNTDLSGKITDLSEYFNGKPEQVMGFLDGINESIKEPLELEAIEEDTEINAEVDWEKLFYNMVNVEATWLYGIEAWDEILTKEHRKEVIKAHKKSKTIVKEPKIGRNDPCPCGSGKKYKKCCGKNA